MIVILGASGGVGGALLNRFEKDGYNVVGTHNSRVSRTAQGNETQALDILNWDDVDSFFQALSEHSLQVINCVALTDADALHKSIPDQWAKTINLNIVGAFHIARACLPLMREKKVGHIINFSSVVTDRIVFGSSAYIASKAAIEALTKSISLENASYGISASTIDLGYSDVGLINSVPDGLKSSLKENIPTGRFCSADEIYNTVKYLFATPYTTGGVLQLRGGL